MSFEEIELIGNTLFKIIILVNVEMADGITLYFCKGSYG